MRLAMLAVVAFAGCAGTTPDVPERPTYLGVKTSLLDGDLVSFDVVLTGAATPEAVETYARCAAAQYALSRDTGCSPGAYSRQRRTLQGL